FKNDCHLQFLTIEGISLAIDINNIQPSGIKELTCQLEYQHHLNILCENLPRLQYLNVQIDKSDQQKNYNIIKQQRLSPFLNQFIITGTYIDYDSLELLIIKYYQSLEYLTLKIRFNNSQFINGHRLKNSLLFKLTNLKRIDFYIKLCVLKRTIDLNRLISTFKTFNYSVICYHGATDKTCTILSNPADFNDCFYIIQNNIVKYCSNMNTFDIKMNKIQTLMLNDRVPLTMELFKFIHDTFLNLEILKINIENGLDSDILTDRKLLLETIIILEIIGSCDYITLKRLLLMTSNIKTLKINDLKLLTFIRRLLDDDDVNLYKLRKQMKVFSQR
ncbi:unnamed protein product, partial [Didymodactylos carnosus]